MAPCSVTRFGEISPIWQNELRLWQNFDGLISNWQIFESTLAKFLCNWANFHGCKWPNIKKLSRYLVTLSPCRHSFPLGNCSFKVVLRFLHKLNNNNKHLRVKRMHFCDKNRETRKQIIFAIARSDKKIKIFE